ncbi:amino acid permease, partial [Nocardia elegans]|nr:amino acid permease [Nocardia elegans]
LIIASIATFATIFVWLMILLAHYRSRRRMSAEETAALRFPVPFWPYGQLITIAFLVFVVAMIAFDADSRVALVVGAVWLALLWLAYRRWVRPTPAATDAAPVAGPGTDPADPALTTPTPRIEMEKNL